MKCEVQIKRKVERGLCKLPADIQKLFFLLVADLQADGPVQKSWRNFSSLGEEWRCDWRRWGAKNWCAGYFPVSLGFILSLTAIS